MLKGCAYVRIDQQSAATRYCQRSRQIQRDKTLSFPPDRARNDEYLGVVTLRRPRSQLTGFRARRMRGVKTSGGVAGLAFT